MLVPARPNSINSPEVDHALHMQPYAGQPAWSLQFDELPKWIVRVFDDRGLVGLGESARGSNPDNLVSVAKNLVGLDAASLTPSTLPIPRCKEHDAFEGALLDLVGKSVGWPLHRLLGGAVRDHVEVSAWSGHRTLDDAVTIARAARDDGFSCIKFKCDLGDDVAGWCAGIRTACGEGMSVILDPNGRFKELRHATRIAFELDQVGNVTCLEDPLPRWNLEDHAALRRHTKLPIAVHVALEYAEDTQRTQDLLRAIRLESADIFNLSAGLLEFQRLATLAEIAARPCWHGSQVDLGILEAGFVHTAAAALACTIPSDIFGRRIREHDLLVEPLAISNGQVTVPTGPGLGVMLDEDALRHYGRREIVVDAST